MEVIIWLSDLYNFIAIWNKTYLKEHSLTVSVWPDNYPIRSFTGPPSAVGSASV